VLSDNATEEDSYQCKDGVVCQFLHNIDNQKEQFNKCYNSPISLAELLQGFFEYYAMYDFSKNVLCPITGTSKIKTRRWANSSSLDLINPLEPNLNVSYNVSVKSVEKFKEQCRKAIKKLNSCRQHNNKEKHNGLFNLFENEELTPQRPRVVVPNLHDLNLLGDDEDEPSRSSGNNRIDLPDIMINKDQGNKPFGRTEAMGRKSETSKTELNNFQDDDIIIPLREDRRETQLQNAKGEKLISKKAFQNLFSSEVKSKSVSVQKKTDTVEDDRIDKLKVKYLRSNAKSKFTHKM